MTDKPDYKKNKKANVKYDGYGQMGIIMLDIQWNAMEEGNGLAELAKPMYDKKMWDDDGAWIQPPTFRAVADIVLDIVGNVTGQKWIGYLDDVLFATLDLTGGYKTPAEVGLELGKKALTSAVSYGASSLRSVASAAASAAITNTAANVAAQAGISMAQSYATSVATSAINSVNLVNGELKFDGEGFGKSLYSASTIGGALGAGVTAGLNEYSLGARTVDGLDADGNAIKTIEYTRAQGLNSTQIDNMGKFNSLMGGLSSSAVSFAMDGKATFNILNASDLGIKSNTGLFELTVGKDGISSTIGSGGTNISMGNLMASLNGAKASVKNTQINNTVNKKYEGNMNVANMLRAQYGFGDKMQLDQLDSILKGNTELIFGNTTDGKAQTVDENGKRIVHMNMDQNGDWKMGAIMLGHESYRDGIVSIDDAQLAETRAAVAGHTDMTLRMMGDNLYAASMAQLVGSNQNLQIDLLARSLGDDIFNKYVDGIYDSSADYWKLVKQEDGKYGLEYDGYHSLYDSEGNLLIKNEMDDLDENGNKRAGSFSASIGMLLGTYTDYMDSYEDYKNNKNEDLRKNSESILLDKYNWDDSQGYVLKDGSNGIIDANPFLMTMIGIKTETGMFNVNLFGKHISAVRIKDEYGRHKGFVTNFDDKSMTNITMIENMIPEGKRLKAGTIEFRNGEVNIYGLGSTLPDPNLMGKDDPSDPGHKYSAIADGTYYYAYSLHNPAGNNPYGALRLFDSSFDVNANWEDVTGKPGTIKTVSGFPYTQSADSVWRAYRQDFSSWYYGDNGEIVTDRTTNVNGHKSFPNPFKLQSYNQKQYIGGSEACLIWQPNTFVQIKNDWNWIQKPIYGKITISRSYFGDGTGGRNDWNYTTGPNGEKIKLW